MGQEVLLEVIDIRSLMSDVGDVNCFPDARETLLPRRPLDNDVASRVTPVSSQVVDDIR